MCQEYIDTFESNIVELNTMNTKLERDIELNARYKDAVRNYRILAVQTLANLIFSLRRY